MQWINKERRLDIPTGHALHPLNPNPSSLAHSSLRPCHQQCRPCHNHPPSLQCGLRDNWTLILSEDKRPPPANRAQPSETRVSIKTNCTSSNQAFLGTPRSINNLQRLPWPHQILEALLSSENNWIRQTTIPIWLPIWSAGGQSKKKKLPNQRSNWSPCLYCKYAPKN